jgi:hypothetical protein
MRPQRGSRATSKIGDSALRAGRAHLASDAAGDRLHERGVPGRGHADRLRIADRAAREEPVQALLVDDRGDPEARLLDQEALDLVGQRGDRGQLEVGRARHTGDLPDPGAEAARGLGRVDARSVEDLEHPQRAELRELLVGRHAVEEVLDAVIDRQRRIQVARLGDACGVGGHPFTAPEVRPLISWRSANA